MEEINLIKVKYYINNKYTGYFDDKKAIIKDWFF